MDENKAELKAKLERTLRKPIPQATWEKYDRDGVIEDYYDGCLEPYGGEEANFRSLRDLFAGELEYLDRIEQEKAQVPIDKRETKSAGDALFEQNLEAESQYFEVELGDYEKERQRAFAEVVAREAGKNQEVVSFRHDYLGGSVLTPDQAYSLMDSPAARYFVNDLFLSLRIPAAEHRAEIVGRYEQVSDVPNDIDHRVTVRVDPPGTTLSVRYARPEPPVTDEGRAETPRPVPGNSQGARMKSPDEVLLRYRDRDGVREVAHIWPGSVLDELRHRSSMLAKMYGWNEEEAVWFFLTGEPPRLSALATKVRFTAGNLPTITLAVAPWVSAETLKKNYQKVQRQVLDKGNHALGLRSIAVLRFVEKNVGENGLLPHWNELLDRWNKEYPEWRYQSFRGLRQAYHRTLDAVVYAPDRLPEPKPSAAVRKRAREASERAREIVELDRKHGSHKQTAI